MFLKSDKNIRNIHAERSSVGHASRFYVQCVLLVMIIFFAVSVYKYSVSHNTLTRVPLYFPTTNAAGISSDTIKFTSEIRAMPKASSSLFLVRRKEVSPVELFMKELLLGPQSIYAANPIPADVKVGQVLKGVHDIIFVELQAPDTRTLSTDENALITKWIQYNLDIRYPTYSVRVFVRGE